MYPLDGKNLSNIVSFGEWVQTWRNQLQLTRPELAREIGCAPITIKKIERDVYTKKGTMTRKEVITYALENGG